MINTRNSSLSVTSEPITKVAQCGAVSDPVPATEAIGAHCVSQVQAGECVSSSRQMCSLPTTIRPRRGVETMRYPVDGAEIESQGMTMS